MRFLKKEIQKVAGGKFFPLDAFEVKTFSSVANKKPYWGEACYMSRTAGVNVFIIKASPKVNWVAAGADPQGNKLFDTTQKKYNLSTIETVRFLVNKEKFPNSNDNDLLFKAKTYSETDRINGRDEIIYWKKEIELALKEKRVQVRAEAIMDAEEDKIVAFEIFTQLAHKDNTVSSYGMIAKWLNEFNYVEKFNLLAYKKAFRYFEEIDVRLHINIFATQLVNDAYVDELLELAKSYRLEEKLVFEIRDISSSKNINELKNFIAKVKALGSKVAIDNVGTLYHKMSYLVLLDVDYIKIENELLKLGDSGTGEQVLELLKALIEIDSKDSGKKELIALKIERPEGIDRLRSHGIKKYQGWILQDETIIF